MKRRRLKRGVLVVIAILVLGFIGKWNYEYNKKAISECVEGGNTVEFCERHLR